MFTLQIRVFAGFSDYDIRCDKIVFKSYQKHSYMTIQRLKTFIVLIFIALNNF